MKPNQSIPTLAISIVLLTVLASGTTLKASEIAGDSFDSYAPGTGNSLVGQNGGSGWAGPWTAGVGNTADVVDTTANPLGFTPAGGTAIEGGARAVELAQTTGNQIVAARQLPTPMPDTFYVAYLFRVTGGNWTDTDTCALHVSADTTSTTTPNFGLRGPNLFMVRTGTGTPVAGASNFVANATVIGTSSYLVARFSKLDASGNPTTTYDRGELWVNPTADDNINNPTGHARLQLAANSGVGTAQYLLVRIAALEAADRAQIDQIVLGTEWADVVPSSTATLIAGIAPGDGTDLVFSWNSQPSKVYNLLSTVDLVPNPATWSTFRTNIAATPPVNTLTVTPSAATRNFFVVQELPAPPLVSLSEDFEGGVGQWTVGSEGGAGTAWELGVPATVGPAAAHSPTNCFGTNIRGTYGLNANVWLRSPVIDLTTAPSATLRFWHYIDIEFNFDWGSVRILDASNNSELAIIAAKVEGLGVDWAQFSAALPPTALGRPIRVEFRLQSDNLDSYAGWYIDDVTLSIP